MRGACQEDDPPKNDARLPSAGCALLPRVMENWDLFKKRGEKVNFVGAMCFVIHENTCVPVFFLGVGGRVGMCHSRAFELGVCSWYPLTGAWCLLLSGRLLRGRKRWGSKEGGGQQEELEVK